MTDRHDHLDTRLTAFLDRRTPPLRLGPAALVAEAQALLAAVLRLAPAQGYEGWWEAVESHVASANRTRSWPSEGDFAEASKAVRASRPEPTGSSRSDEAATVDLLERHYRATGSQLGGLGRPHRTQALIARGVLADLREARFRGFDLTEEQGREAREMRPGRAEWDHHVGVMARLRHQFPSEAEAQCIDETSADQLREHLAVYGRSGPAPLPTMPARGFRRMSEPPTGRETDDGSWRDPAPPLAVEEIAARPYTDAERARMRAIHGIPEPRREEAQP